MNKCKIYYGFKKENTLFLDECLMNEIARGYSFDDGINTITENNIECWTINPLLINYLDDEYVKENVYYFDTNLNQEVLFKDNSRLCGKLSYLGGGEALCDTLEVKYIF